MADGLAVWGWQLGKLSRVFQSIMLVFVLITLGVGEARAAEPAASFTGRWIDVNLTSLRITAYQGTKAVRSAPVTTGKAGYRTPTGTFHILSRFRVQDMKSAPGDPNPYFQPNVEYIQYFYFPGGFALHANYWQPASVFGRANTSHGCVGMLTRDAIYFWSFASVGTPVYIHYGATKTVTPVVKVGSVVGKKQAAATSALKASGLKVSTAPRVSMLDAPGTVLAQTPAAGRTVNRGSTVKLTVAVARAFAPTRAPEGDFAWAPDVVGLSESEAIARIEKAGLKATYVNYYDESNVPASQKSALLKVKKGAVFAAMTDVGQIRLRGSDYALSVRRP